MRKFFKLLIAAGVAVQASAASAAWNEAVSKHFHVYADEDPAELRAFATRLETFDAAVREARGTPDVAPGAATQVTVYVLRDIPAIAKLFGDTESGVAGFYEPRATGSVAFVPRRGGVGKFKLGAENIFFHEYTHHLMLQDTDRPMPTWLVEGFAEFFATPIFNDDGSVTIGAPPKYRAEALYSADMWGLPLNKMLSGDYNYLTGMEFESLYGRGWLLTHLLSFDLKRRGQLTRYLDEIRSGRPALQAAQDSFGDLKALDRELGRYFKTDVFTVSTIPASKLHLPPIEVRPLSPTQAAMMDIQIRLARGGKKLWAGQVAGRARHIVEANAPDAQAEVVLAQIELAAEDYGDAAKHADVALKLDPRSGPAMMAKGEALMNLAKANPASADWEAIRANFVGANKIDPENAAPLILFYRSFLAQGVHPTQNALEGLDYAVALAPQDSQLRMELIGQLIDDKKLSDARKALVPLAYSPHTGKAHDAVSKIMDGLQANDQARAKAAWQAAERFYE
jgi:tetratricopeptide (TPR) repeat protein